MAKIRTFLLWSLLLVPLCLTAEPVRLPRPRTDPNIWGALINQFLRVSHNEDGTLKAFIIDLADITGVEPNVQDYAGLMFSDNTEIRCTLTYQAADRTVDVVVDAIDSLLDETFKSAGLLKRRGAQAYGVAVEDTDYQQPVTWGTGLKYSAPVASLDGNDVIANPLSADLDANSHDLKKIDAVYMGDPSANNTFRMRVSGSNRLVIEKKVGGVWTSIAYFQ